MKIIYSFLMLLLLSGATASGQVSFKKFYGAPSNTDFGADIFLTQQGEYLITGGASNGDNGFDFYLLETDAAGSPTGFEWYGGPKNDVALRLIPLSDGGHLLLGYTESYGQGGSDGYALRLDAAGNPLWSKTTGGNYDDQIIDGLQLEDGSFILATNVFSPAGGNDILLERRDANGNLIVSRSLTNGQEYFCRRLLAGPDGIYLAGIYDGLGFISKIQSDNLTEIWFKTYSSTGPNPQALVRIEDLIHARGSNRYLAVGRTLAPSTNTVFTFDGDGNVLDAFNTLLSGKTAERLALHQNGTIFIAGSDRLELRDSSGLILYENNGFDNPTGIPENIRGMAVLPSGGVALIGNTRIYQQGRDAMFSLLDTALEVTTTQLYWNLGPRDGESGYSARQTPDGGYLLCGEKYSADTYEDIWLIKTDATGNVVWESTTGSSGIDVVRTMDLSGDNAFVITGFSYDVEPGEPAVLFVRKFDLAGNELWVKFFPLGSPNFSAYALIRTLSDGGYIIAMNAAFFSALRKPTLLRLDSSGNILWSKAYEGYSNTSFIRNIMETPEGNLLGIGAYSDSRIQATLFNSLGTEIWSYAYGAQNGIGYGLAATPDNHIVISGFTDSDGSGNDSLYVATIDEAGLVVWEQYLEGGGYAWPRVQVNQTGEIFLSSNAVTPDPSGDGVLEYIDIRKLDADGTPIWTREIHGLENMLFFESQLADDGGLFFFGYADNANSRDYCLIKTDAEGVVPANTVWKHAGLPEVFPSPATDELSIRWTDAYTGTLIVSVFDATGVPISRHFLEKNSAEFKHHFDVSHFPAGAYFIQMRTNDGFISRSFIKG